MFRELWAAVSAKHLLALQSWAFQIILFSTDIAFCQQLLPFKKTCVMVLQVDFLPEMLFSRRLRAVQGAMGS